MLTLLDVGLIALSGFIAYEDLRFRAISWYTLPVLLVLGTIKSILAVSWVTTLTYLGINLGMVLVQMGTIAIYYMIKQGKISNVINQGIGIGDVLYLFALLPLFAPVNFMGFLILGYLLTLIGYLVYQRTSSNSNPNIPLAGGLSCLIIFCILVGLFTNPHYLTDDTWILPFMAADHG